MAEKLICPLLAINADRYGDYTRCLGAYCAWWDEVKARCAVLVLARPVITKEEIERGARNEKGQFIKMQNA